MRPCYRTYNYLTSRFPVQFAHQSRASRPRLGLSVVSQQNNLQTLTEELYQKGFRPHRKSLDVRQMEKNPKDIGDDHGAIRTPNLQ